jgi:uncharacterized protein
MRPDTQGLRSGAPARRSARHRRVLGIRAGLNIVSRLSPTLSLGWREPAARWQANGVTARILVLSVFLVGYGNTVAQILGSATPAGPWPGVVLGLLLLGILLAWACWIDRLTPEEIGLTPAGHLLRSAALGLVLALGAAVPAMLFLRFPPLVGQAIEYAPLGSLSREALLWRTFVWMPLDTAIPEEIAFRGVLLALLRRRFATLPAVFIMAVVFTGWHGVVVSRTVALTNLQSEPLLAGLGLLGAFLAVCVGAGLFAWLRLATGHLAASIVAHWVFNAVLLLGLQAGGSSPGALTPLA